MGLSCQMKRESMDISAISPLSQGVRVLNDSETDDEEESISNSSASPNPPPNGGSYHFDRLLHLQSRRGSRHSHDENEDDNQGSNEDDETSDEEEEETVVNTYQYAPKQVSVSLDAVNEFEEGDKDGTHGRYAQGQTFISMELQLIAMNEKVAALMNEVQSLKQRNTDLEDDKLKMVKNTAIAMNDCRQTIQKLCVQNQQLLQMTNAQPKVEQSFVEIDYFIP